MNTSPINAEAQANKNTLAWSIAKYLSPHLSSYERREKYEQIKVETDRAEIWR